MKTHYYLGWFKKFFPKNPENALQKDLTDQNSLVLVSSNPSNDDDDSATERSWLHNDGIRFDETHTSSITTYRKTVLRC